MSKNGYFHTCFEGYLLGYILTVPTAVNTIRAQKALCFGSDTHARNAPLDQWILVISLCSMSSITYFLEQELTNLVTLTLRVASKVQVTIKITFFCLALVIMLNVGWFRKFTLTFQYSSVNSLISILRAASVSSPMVHSSQ